MNPESDCCRDPLLPNDRCHVPLFFAPDCFSSSAIRASNSSLVGSDIGSSLLSSIEHLALTCHADRTGQSGLDQGEQARDRDEGPGKPASPPLDSASSCPWRRHRSFGAWQWEEVSASGESLRTHPSHIREQDHSPVNTIHAKPLFHPEKGGCLHVGLQTIRGSTLMWPP
jgi:hypothetical protein